MREILVAEVFQGARHRGGGGFPETAERGVGNHPGQVLQHIEVLKGALSRDDPFENFKHPAGSLAAGHALAAGFVLCEVHKEPRHLDHAGVLVHNDEAARSDHRADLFERVEIKRDAEVGGDQAAARRTADLHRLEIFAVLDSAADVHDDLAQSGSHRHLDQAGVVDVSGQGEGFGARAFLGTDRPVPIRAVLNDQRDVGKGLDVIEDGGFAE